MINLRGRKGGGRCVYCREDFQRAQATSTCGECRTRLHRACVEELGSCPTLGCGGDFQASAKRARKRRVEPSPEEEPTWGLGDAVKVILVVLAIGATLLGFQVSLDHRLRRRLSHMISPPPPPGPPSPLTLVQALLLNPQDREALQICARRGPQLVPALVREVRLEIGFLDAAARAVLAMGGPGVKALRAYEGPNPESERAAKLILERVEALKAGRE